MQKNNIDRRIRRTKSHLKESLLKLLTTKDIKHITISELTELADINRGTFYLHYKDVYDMLDKIENELIEEFTTVVNNHVEAFNEPFDLEPLFCDIFCFVQKHSKLSLILLGDNFDSSFATKFRKVVREKCHIAWKNRFSVNNSIAFNYFYTFIMTGTTGIVYEWLNDDMHETAESMAGLTVRIFTHGLIAIGE